MEPVPTLRRPSPLDAAPVHIGSAGMRRNPGLAGPTPAGYDDDNAYVEAAVPTAASPIPPYDASASLSLHEHTTNPSSPPTTTAGGISLSGSSMKHRPPRRSGNDTGGGAGGWLYGSRGDDGSGGAPEPGTVTWKDAAMNLTNCVMGAGALSLPSFFKSCGVVTGTVLLVVSCLWTWASVLMMLSAADVLSQRSFGGVPIASYEDLLGHTLGSRGRAVSTVGILLLQLGCLVGYANILADVVSPFAIDILPPGLEPNRGAILTAVTLSGMLPVGLVVGGENPSLLATVSQFSLGIVATFAVVMSVHAFYPEKGAGPTGALPGPVVYSNPPGVMSVLPLVIFAFGAHPAVLPVIKTMKHPVTLKASTSVVSAVLGACAVGYMLIGLGGYLSFRSSTAGNVLRNLDGVFLGNSLSKTIKFGYAIVILGSVPTILLPLQKSAKDAFLFLVPSAAMQVMPGGALQTMVPPPGAKQQDSKKDFNKVELSDVEKEKMQAQETASAAAAGIGTFAVKGGGGGAGGGGTDGAATAVDVTPEVSARISQAVALSSMLSALCLALYVPNVEFAFGLTGSTCSFLIAFVLPSLAYLKVTAPGAKRSGGGKSGMDSKRMGDIKGGHGSASALLGDGAEGAGGGSGAAAAAVSLSGGGWDVGSSGGGAMNNGWESVESEDDVEIGGGGDNGFDASAGRARFMKRRRQMRQWSRIGARVQIMVALVLGYLCTVEVIRELMHEKVLVEVVSKMAGAKSAARDIDAKSSHIANALDSFVVGLNVYTCNAVDIQLASAWFQPLHVQGVFYVR